MIIEVLPIEVSRSLVGRRSVLSNHYTDVIIIVLFATWKCRS